MSFLLRNFNCSRNLPDWGLCGQAAKQKLPRLCLYRKLKSAEINSEIPMQAWMQLL